MCSGKVYTTLRFDSCQHFVIFALPHIYHTYKHVSIYPSSYIHLSIIHQAILSFDPFQSKLPMLVYIIPRYFSIHINQSLRCVYGSFLRENLPSVKYTNFKLTIQCVFDKCTHLCHPNFFQDLGYFHQPTKFLPVPSQLSLIPISPGNIFYYRSVLLVLEHHVNGITQQILSCKVSFTQHNDFCDLPILLCVSVAHSFVFLCIPLYDYTTVSLSLPQLMDIWVVSSWELL